MRSRPWRAFYSWGGLSLGLSLCLLFGSATAVGVAAQEPPASGPVFDLPPALGLGTPVEPFVYAAWNISISPDGRGLPPGGGTAERGEKLFYRLCAGCHTVSHDNAHGFPVLAGGRGSLAGENPLMTVGSYWPYATTLFDYIHRAMPFPEPQSLEPDAVYSLTAFILWSNGILEKDQKDRRLGPEHLAELNAVMPNHDGFVSPDPRPDTDNLACMADCPPLGSAESGPTAAATLGLTPGIGHAASYPRPGLRARTAASHGPEASATPTAPVELPFDIQLEPVELELPVGNGTKEGLHSASSAVVETGARAGAWLIVGGRTDGLHKTGDRYQSKTSPSFPEERDNDRLWAIDPESGAVVWVPAWGLPRLLHDALTSTNQQSVQRGDVLWIVGGYGWNGALEKYGTFGYLIAVDVPRLVEAIFARPGEALREPHTYFSWGTVPDGCLFFDESGCRAPEGSDRFELTVTGGGLEQLEEDLVLALGQRFGGEYNPTDSRHFAQFYTCRVVSFARPEPRWGAKFEVPEVQILAQGGDHCSRGDSGNADDPFHRRDLNVAALMLPACGAGVPAECRSRVEGVGLYGGVFTSDFSGHTAPILIRAEGGEARRTVVVYGSHSQAMLQYEAARLSLYDAERASAHTVILGGMGVRWCTAGQKGPGIGREIGQCTATRAVQPPAFTGDGTILSWTANGAFSQAFLYQPFAAADGELLGANALFLPRPDVPRTANGVIELSQLPADRYTSVGHVFGGIATHGPAPKHVLFRDGPSWASWRAFEVRIRPRRLLCWIC